NLKGVWLCMKEEIPQMLKEGGGAIVNTASIAGLIGLQTSSAYVAAKHGVVGLTKTAALEYAEAKIRVNAVCPGFIQTAMTEDTMKRRGEAIIGQIPFGRMGQPGETADRTGVLRESLAATVTFCRYAVHRFSRDGCFAAAGALSYTTLVSLVPLGVIALGVLSAFPNFATVRQQLLEFVFRNFVPQISE